MGLAATQEITLLVESQFQSLLIVLRISSDIEQFIFIMPDYVKQENISFSPKFDFFAICQHKLSFSKYSIKT